jgi:hypothetical protein
MGKEVIQKILKIQGEFGHAEAEAILDTGASISLIKSDMVAKVSRILPALLKKVKLGDGKTTFIVDKAALVAFELGGFWLDDVFFVSDSLPADMIVGIPTLQKWEIDIDFKTKEIKVGLTPDDLYLF